MKKKNLYVLLYTLGTLMTSCVTESSGQASPSLMNELDHSTSKVQSTQLSQTPQSPQLITPTSKSNPESPLLQKGYFSEMINGKLKQLDISIGMKIEDLIRLKGEPKFIEKQEGLIKYRYDEFIAIDSNDLEDSNDQLISGIILQQPYISHVSFQQLQEVMGHPSFDGESEDTDAQLMIYRIAGYILSFYSNDYSSDQVWVTRVVIYKSE